MRSSHWPARGGSGSSAVCSVLRQAVPKPVTDSVVNPMMMSRNQKSRRAAVPPPSGWTARSESCAHTLFRSRPNSAHSIHGADPTRPPVAAVAVPGGNAARHRRANDWVPGLDFRLIPTRINAGFRRRRAIAFRRRAIEAAKTVDDWSRRAGKRFARKHDGRIGGVEFAVTAGPEVHQFINVTVCPVSTILPDATRPWPANTELVGGTQCPRSIQHRHRAPFSGPDDRRARIPDGPWRSRRKSVASARRRRPWWKYPGAVAQPARAACATREWGHKLPPEDQSPHGKQQAINPITPAT